MKSKVNFNADEFIKRYRQNNIENKVKMLSKLESKDRDSVLKLLTPKEIQQYRAYSSQLIERRYNTIKNHKECLDAVTALNPNIKKIREKYLHQDLSITVYTIKAIINVYEGSGASRDDGSGRYSKNASKYYKVCKRYWENITWDTDTQYLGWMNEKNVDHKRLKYHRDANKVRTILKALKEKKKIGKVGKSPLEKQLKNFK